MITSNEDLPSLPDGAMLTVPFLEEQIEWRRAYLRPHRDSATGLWRLPRNPFTEYGVDEIEVDLPTDADIAVLPPRVAIRGDEEWLSTLDDPHDTTQQY